MERSETGPTINNKVAFDVEALLNGSFDDAPEPSSALLVRAANFAHEADQKLKEARGVKAEAERFRAEMQKSTMEQAEALYRYTREEAGRERSAAHELDEATHTVIESAKAEFERATVLKEDAEAIRIRATKDAAAYNEAALADAHREALNIKEEARAIVNADLFERQEQVDQEIRKALSAIETMQAAGQAETEAQQMYTEALRFRAASPHWNGDDLEPLAEAPAPAKTRRPRKS